MDIDFSSSKLLQVRIVERHGNKIMFSVYKKIYIIVTVSACVLSQSFLTRVLGDSTRKNSLKLIKPSSINKVSLV